MHAIVLVPFISAISPTLPFVLPAIIEEDRRTALSLSIYHGFLGVSRYLVDTMGITLTGELY